MWGKDICEAISKLSLNRESDGDGRQKIVETIHTLFGFHLTVRASNARIDSGLEWESIRSFQ